MAEQGDIDALKLLVGSELLDDTALGKVLDLNENNYTLAAAQVWEIRAGKYSTLVDVTESGSSRALGKMHSNALEMAKFYRQKASDSIVDPDDEPVVVAPSRTRRIVRE